MRELGLLPVLVLCLLVLVYHDSLDYRGLSLVLTNSFGALPFAVCIQNGNYPDAIPFFSIILTSGSYHLCNSMNYEHAYCGLPKAFYVSLDFINAYACVGTVLVRLLDTSYSSELNAVNAIAYTVVVAFTDRVVPVVYTAVLALVVVVKMIVRREQYTFVVNADFLTGLVLAVIAFSVYVSTVYYGIDERDYWALHAFGWHVPVMLSSAFVLRSTAKRCRVQTITV